MSTSPPTPAGSVEGGLAPPQEIVERALAASRADGCVVLVEDLSQAEVRFANNTTTTNGVRRSRRVAVVTFRTTVAGASGAGAWVRVPALRVRGRRPPPWRGERQR